MPELGFQERRSWRRRGGDTSPDSVIFTLESNLSLFSSASASVDRCSFASDAHDHDSLASEISLVSKTTLHTFRFFPLPLKEKLKFSKSEFLVVSSSCSIWQHRIMTVISLIAKAGAVQIRIWIRINDNNNDMQIQIQMQHTRSIAEIVSLGKERKRKVCECSVIINLLLLLLFLLLH